MIRIPCFVAACSLFLFSSVGCTWLTVPHHESPPEAGDFETPVRCLCLWQPVDGVDAAGQSVRGFGGQVYFFAADSEEPVAVDGNVRVFIFDDVGTPDQQARPKDVQDFDSVTWQSFLGKSQFGVNYTVFVPYAQASRYESICSLRLKLSQPDGTQVFSEMATVKLAGEPREDRTIRKLVSPKEHSISPERSQELRVDYQQHDTSTRAATIGSIQDGNVSRRNNSALPDHRFDDHARLRIQRYEARLAEMHHAYSESNDHLKSQPRRDFETEFADLMPAIRKVSRGESLSRHRVRPAAHEVFSAEEPQSVRRASHNDDRSQSSL